MTLVPVTDFIRELPLQLRKAHHIQPLKDVSTMRWISNELDIQLPSFPEELKGEVRGVPIEKNHPCTTGCFLTLGWIETLDEPV